MQNFYTCFRCNQSWPEDFFTDVKLVVQIKGEDVYQAKKICKQCEKEITQITADSLVANPK